MSYWAKRPGRATSNFLGGTAHRGQMNNAQKVLSLDDELERNISMYRTLSLQAHSRLNIALDYLPSIIDFTRLNAKRVIAQEENDDRDVIVYMVLEDMAAVFYNTDFDDPRFEYARLRQATKYLLRYHAAIEKKRATTSRVSDRLITSKALKQALKNGGS